MLGPDSWVPAPLLLLADSEALGGACYLSLLQSPKLQSEKRSLGGLNELICVKVLRVPHMQV